MHSLSCFRCAHNPCNELLETYSNAIFALTAQKENYTSLEKKKKGVGKKMIQIPHIMIHFNEGKTTL